MFVAAVVGAVLLAVVFTAAGVAKLAGEARTVHQADHLRVPRPAYRAIGALEVAGAVGLLVGLNVAGLGTAAAAGLAVLMTGAVGAHLRAGDSPADAGPALALAVLSLVTLALRAMTT
jgi:uncharacterized membrane protein YphA (DoxX/SURF4 family)